MSEGSIKGAAVEPIVNLTHELLGSGQISRQQLETRLESSDLGLLEVKPEPTLWYPIASAERIELFVAEVLGRDIEEMMREIGGAAARRVLAQPGIRTFIEGARKHGERMGHILAGLGALVVDFGDWRFEGDMFSEFRVRAMEVEALPDTTRYATEGFIEVLAQKLIERPANVSSQRPSRGHVVFDVRVGD
jgi:hypothetical protein